MSEVQLPPYLTIESTLQQQGLNVPPAEIHGLLTGLLCAGHAKDDLSYLAAVSDSVNDRQPLSDGASQTVTALFDISVAGLASDELSFEMLLPDDETALVERAEHFSEWVGAFLVGMGLMDMKSKKPSSDLTEAMGDLQEMAQLGIDEDDDMVEQADLFEQVLEHTRMCVMTCFAELGQRPDAAESKPTLH